MYVGSPQPTFLLLMNNLRRGLDIGIYLIGIDNPITKRSGNFLKGLHFSLTEDNMRLAFSPKHHTTESEGITHGK